MKKYFLSFLLLLASIHLFAQFETIAEGPSFKERIKGYSKVLLLKDGCTFYLSGRKNETELRFYNALHNEVFVGSLPFELSGNSKMETLFEQKGEVVLIVSVIEGKLNTLVRYRLNANDGKLIDRTELMSMPKPGGGSRFGMRQGLLDRPEYAIRRDTVTGDYAIAKYNTLESDRNKRVEIFRYGLNHEEISRTNFESPDNKYKYIEYIDMVFTADRQLNVLVNAYNTKNSGGEANELLLGTIGMDKIKFSTQSLEFARNHQIGGAVIRYNAISKKLLVAANTWDKSEFAYIPNLLYMDPVTKQVEFNGIAQAPGANLKSMELFGSKRYFRGVIQNMYIHEDGSFTILFEEMTYFYVKGYKYATLENVAVAHYNLLGHPVSDYLIPKEHNFFNGDINSFYLSKREEGFGLFDFGDQFKSIAYIAGKNNSYLVMNDPKANEEYIKKGKIINVSKMTECDAFYFNLSGAEVVPERKMLFPKPGPSGLRHLVVTEVADFEKSTNTYVTIKLERSGKENLTRLVWLRP